MAKKEKYYPQGITLLDAYISGKFDLPEPSPSLENGEGDAKDLTQSLIFPFGIYGTYVFNLPRMMFQRVDEAVGDFLGKPSRELTTAKLPAIIHEVVIPEHQRAGITLANMALEWLHQHPHEEATVNFECNVKNGAHGHRRLLFQARPSHFNGDGYLSELEGRVIDISHILGDGPPRLTILAQGKLVFQETGSPEDLLRSLDLPLNAKDITVLALKNKGMRVKEIARQLNMQELSIYSIFRDIKKKTQLELLPLINLLKEKGLIERDKH